MMQGARLSRMRRASSPMYSPAVIFSKACSPG